MALDIRIFRTADCAAARTLWEAMIGVGLSEADSPENVARFLERNPGFSYVATDEGGIVATILCGHDGRRGLIHHLAVVPSHQRQGIGRSLVQCALGALRGAGIQKCHLLVFNENAAGRAFWRRVGAEERTTLELFSIMT